jgi:hypothetical protein
MNGGIPDWLGRERCDAPGSPLGLFAFFANAIKDTVDKVNDSEVLNLRAISTLH